MFFCSNCFADTEIKAIIDGNKTIGTCDFCGSMTLMSMKSEEIR